MRVLDSHTEGEPTRLIVEGGPALGNGPLAKRRRLFAERFDDVRAFARKCLRDPFPESRSAAGHNRGLAL